MATRLSPAPRARCQNRPSRVALRPFGEGSSAEVYGFDLDVISGWLEDLVSVEGERVDPFGKGPKSKRFLKIERAKVMILEALDGDYSLSEQP